MVVFIKMKQVLFSRLRRVGLAVFWLCTAFLSAVTWPVMPVSSQDVQDVTSVFEISLAELGYGERVLDSPLGTAEYTLRLPEGWELREESFFELDFSYIQEWLAVPQGDIAPSSYGALIVTIDDLTPEIVSIDNTFIEHSRLRIELDPAHFNDPYWAGRRHSILVTLDSSSICGISHRARLIVHPASFFRLSYGQRAVVADLGIYPRPFYQSAFEPDQVRFVLPEQPTEPELAGALAVAARLGSLTSGVVVSSTTDSQLLDLVDEQAESYEHLVVIGKPDTNQVIRTLDQMGVLPVSLHERQLELTSIGPAIATLTDVLTYTLTVTNTTRQTISFFSLTSLLPYGSDLVECDPSCDLDAQEGEINWSVPPLGTGETISYAFRLRLSETITDGVLENTATLFDAAAEPINVSTLTTTVRSDAAQESGVVFHSASGIGDTFFVRDGRAVSEQDGIVQEIVAPWDQTRVILILTGLSDSALLKASAAMSSSNQFPEMDGSHALVSKIYPPLESMTDRQSIERTFADLGYEDRLLGGSSLEASYSFDLPAEWQLGESAFVELYFSHSQRIKYEGASLNVFFNGTPVATVALDNRTALNGRVKAFLPSSKALPGRNRITVRSVIASVDPCVVDREWLFISSESLLYLDHREGNGLDLILDFYPHPFTQRSSLDDVLFVLPSEPLPGEWQYALQLSYALGRSAYGSRFAPAVALGENSRTDADLGNYHLIVVGRPSRNGMLRRVNDLLPQPFLPGLDQIDQRLNTAILRISPEVNLGYVQLVPSPWNEQRALLALTGTREEGVAGTIWLVANQPWQLRGNLVLVQGDQVRTIDTRPLTRAGVETIVRTVVPGTTVSVITPAPTASIVVTGTPSGTVTPVGTLSAIVPTRTASTFSTGATRPAWLIPLVVGAIVVTLAILGFAIWQSRRR